MRLRTNNNNDNVDDDDVNNKAERGNEDNGKDESQAIHIQLFSLKSLWRFFLSLSLSLHRSQRSSLGGDADATASAGASNVFLHSLSDSGCLAGPLT